MRLLWSIELPYLRIEARAHRICHGMPSIDSVCTNHMRDISFNFNIFAIGLLIAFGPMSFTQSIEKKHQESNTIRIPHEIGDEYGIVCMVGAPPAAYVVHVNHIAYKADGRGKFSLIRSLRNLFQCFCWTSATPWQGRRSMKLNDRQSMKIEEWSQMRLHSSRTYTRSIDSKKWLRTFAVIIFIGHATRP